jgi:ribose/xylose/arabinose/galactoside ABC-type transport system permease subunit
MASVDTRGAERPAPAPQEGPLLGGTGLRGSLTFFAFLLIFAAYALWLGDKFTSADARLLDVHQNSAVLLLGLAVLITLIAGQFDLSVASLATLTAALTVGLKSSQGLPFALVLLVALVVGVVGGFVNGLLVERLKINTFIATLGTGGVFLGVSSVYSKGTQISPGTGSNALPTWFTGPDSFGALSGTVPSVVVWLAFAAFVVAMFFALRRLRPADYGPRTWDIAIGVCVAVVVGILLVLDLSSWIDQVSWTIGFVFVVAFVLWVLLGFTTYGRYVRATGSNAVAARLAGVHTGSETIKAFVLGGLLAALAGIVLAANQGAFSPGVATPFLLPAFAAAFLSTVMLSTGKFHVWGTILGGIFLVWVSQGLIVGGLPFQWTDVVNGVVLILAVAVSAVHNLRRTT